MNAFLSINVLMGISKLQSTKSYWSVAAGLRNPLIQEAVIRAFFIEILRNIHFTDCNWTRTQNHLVRKRTLNHLMNTQQTLNRPVWPNGWVFVYELNGSGFESSCSHLIFRFRACFEQGILWHSGNYRVWIHSETSTWQDKNIQL